MTEAKKEGTTKAAKKEQSIYEVLSFMQKSLAVPKGEFNSFGGYAYRKAEDILNAAKKILPDGYSLTTNDDIYVAEVRAGAGSADRVYHVAVATLTAPDGSSVSKQAFAKEDDTKKGMDGSQLSGSCMSYAKKYALANLFAIDNEKDADGMDNTSQPVKPAGAKPKSMAQAVAQAPKPAAPPISLLRAEVSKLAKLKPADEQKDAMAAMKGLVETTFAKAIGKLTDEEAQKAIKLLEEKFGGK